VSRRLATSSLICFLCAVGAFAAEIAPGVDLIPGRFVPNVQPDGNTVIFRGTDGLIVLDTGRHPEHALAVIDTAREAHLPVKAIVNSHWHLDHVGGNVMLRRAYPGAKVYASAAIADALKGFLAGYRSQLQDAIAQTPDVEKQKPWQAEIALIDAGPALGPDEVVTAPGSRTIAGRALELGLEDHAVTAGDVWVFDPATRVLAAGDLVTLPVPLFDTACPESWKASLDRLAKKDFRVLVPGHGAPLSPEAFDTYRSAFDHLVACAASAAPKDDCVGGWMKDAGTLIEGEDPKWVRFMLDYYVGNQLRGDPAQAAKLCGKGS
jgi:glyoxylase-like metal-dependent hydrolase (beta-lactamase superfamily II)